MSEFPSGDEIEAIEILGHLSEMIKHRRSIFPHEIPEWGSKRRRSIPECLKLGSQSPIIKEGSPATPLAFVQCESEEKLKILKRKYLHRQKVKREDLVEKIDELTIRRDLMSQELEKVRAHYDKLKADNLGLKAKKNELIGTELKGETQGMKSGQNSQLNQGLRDPPLKENLTVDTEFRTPDLNVKYVFDFDESFTADVFQPLDHSMVNVRDQSRAMASEARRNRIQICRAKKSRSL